MAADKTFALLAILSLALGIGANTTIFSFMESILFRSLPVEDPDALVMLRWTAPPDLSGDSSPVGTLRGVLTPSEAGMVTPR